MVNRAERTENFEDDNRIHRMSPPETRRPYVPASTTVNTTIVRSRISWGGIFAGLFIAMATQATLIMLPLSFGMVFLGPSSPGSAEVIGWSTVIIHTLTMALSLFLGAFVAARFSNVALRPSGALHGLTVWALAVIFNFLLIGQIFTGITSSVSDAVKGLAGLDVNFSLSDTLPEGLRSEMNKYNLTLQDLRSELGQISEETGNPNLTENALEGEASEVRSIGNRALRSILLTPSNTGEDFDQMVQDMINTTRDTWGSITTNDIANVIASRSDLSTSESTTVAQRWKTQLDSTINNLERNIQEAKNEVVRKSDQAMDWLGKTAIFSFFFLAIGAFVGIFGGIVGTPTSNINIPDDEQLH